VKGKFKVRTDLTSAPPLIIPKPTAAEERYFGAMLDDADVMRGHVTDALEDLRNIVDERLRKLPYLRRERVTKLIARTENALLELEDELDEVIESDNDVYEKAAMLNEIAAAKKGPRPRRCRR